MRRLLEAAEQARAKAYAPYSRYAVGAALLCDDGAVYTGCNVENAAYSPGCCAERLAVYKAVSEGRRGFTAIAVVGGPLEGRGRLCAPCGVCRQVLREFCGAGTKIILALPGALSEYKTFTLGELLPESFGPENLLG